MDEGFVESLLVRAVLGIVAQVPFAEDATDVAGLAQVFGKRDFGQVHVGGLAIHVGDARAEVVAAGHQRRPRRRADRADVELREFRGLAGERVDLRRLDVRVAVASHIAVAQIVDEEQDDVRSADRLRRLGGMERGQRGQRNGSEQQAGASHKASASNVVNCSAGN